MTSFQYCYAMSLADEISVNELDSSWLIVAAVSVDLAISTTSHACPQCPDQRMPFISLIRTQTQYQLNVLISVCCLSLTRATCSSVGAGTCLDFGYVWLDTTVMLVRGADLEFFRTCLCITSWGRLS